MMRDVTQTPFKLKESNSKFDEPFKRQLKDQNCNKVRDVKKFNEAE